MRKIQGPQLLKKYLIKVSGKHVWVISNIKMLK